MKRVLAVANQKGGVGKTFVVFHLAHFLAEKRKRCLLVDLDPQGNLSLSFQLPRGFEPSCEVAEIFARQEIKAQEISPYIFLVPSDIRLARYEASSGGVGIYFKLKRALEEFSKNHPVDYVLIDCPPSLGLFSLSAFVAADALLIPLRPEMFSVSGLGDLLQVVQEVKENINAALEILGLILNAVQERTKIARQTLTELAQSVELPVLAKLPLSIKAEEALRKGKPVWELTPEVPLARALQEGLHQILEVLEGKKNSQEA